MSRQPRLAFAGRPHFVLQRGHGVEPVFRDDEDRRHYLRAVFESARSGGVAVHGYALSECQVQLLATPARSEDLGRFMQRVGRRYVAEFNRRHGREGPLWHGRFQAAAIDPARYLLPCLLIIEQAPLRDGSSMTAVDFAWSSAAHNAGVRRDPLVDEHAFYWALGNTPFERQARYAEALSMRVADREVAQMLVAVRRGWPIGASEFVASVEREHGRSMRPGVRGRPRRAPAIQPVPNISRRHE